jgi:ABC-type sugar transport system substrate-binding protein
LEATGGSGAAEALHRLSMDGKRPMVAFDGDPETLDWIDRGVISATVPQKPCVMSYCGLKFLADLHHNAVHQFKDWRTSLAPPMPALVDTGTVVVDKNNLKLYREALAPHPRVILPQWFGNREQRLDRPLLRGGQHSSTVSQKRAVSALALGYPRQAG